MKTSNKESQALFDPDARFLLANERTLLAWIRTALTLQAGGVAVIHLGDESKSQTSLGVAIIILGGAMALAGYSRFRAADKAIRTGQLPSIGNAPFLQTAAVILIAVVLIAAQISGLI